MITTTGNIESSLLHSILSFEAYHFLKNDDPQFQTKREGSPRHGMAWHRFASMAEPCPVLDLPNPVLLQHFRLGLLEDSGMILDAISGGALVLLEPERGKEILGELQDFSSPPVLSDVVAKRGNEELPRSICESPCLHTNLLYALVEDIILD
jgi:hypothetical protein